MSSLSLGLAYLAAGLGAAGATIGGGLGIGKLASAAMEGVSRQPEAAGDIRGMMILTAAMVEGIALFAIVVCILLLFMAK
ncbi:ATP synthase subunit c [bacterium BMS3Abin05]|nr:ATP synthase subunit c [bacterium BMS3Abin05]GBE26319.1 ATP synthase subunit c [bacterium BMS3Bbin03]HDK35374.1 ATP synthase F0 subunit C [Bacteroidota bacterium]HDZ11868.1 ATP synthase F0 subunit C [Bacteroidota bacterium]